MNTKTVKLWYNGSMTCSEIEAEENTYFVARARFYGDIKLKYTGADRIFELVGDEEHVDKFMKRSVGGHGADWIAM